MKTVTQDEFYAIIGPMNVVGSIVGEFTLPVGYTTELRTNDNARRLCGVRTSDGAGLTTFALTDEVAA